MKHLIEFLLLIGMRPKMQNRLDLEQDLSWEEFLAKLFYQNNKKT